MEIDAEPSIAAGRIEVLQIREALFFAHRKVKKPGAVHEHAVTVGTDIKWDRGVAHAFAVVVPGHSEERSAPAILGEMLALKSQTINHFATRQRQFHAAPAVHAPDGDRPYWHLLNPGHRLECSVLGGRFDQRGDNQLRLTRSYSINTGRDLGDSCNKFLRGGRTDRRLEDRYIGGCQQNHQTQLCGALPPAWADFGSVLDMDARPWDVHG